MNTDIKALWVAALRSGKYRQGIDALHYKTERQKDRFCCLGILCRMAEERGVVNSSPDGIKILYDEEPSTLPPSVMQWADLESDNPKVYNPKDGMMRDLATLNDEGYTFKKIAQLIEESDL